MQKSVDAGIQGVVVTKRDEQLNTVTNELDKLGVKYTVEWGKGSHRKIRYTLNGRPGFFLVTRSATHDQRCLHGLRTQVRRAFRIPATGTSGR